MKRILLGGIIVAALTAAGCEMQARPGAVTVGYDYDIGPDWDWYAGGAYVGPYWVWHDRAGHEFREERAIHERRMQEHPEHFAHR